MAVVIGQRHITMTATADACALGSMKKLIRLSFQGTGLTAGQRLVVRDGSVAGTGNILADYQTEAATDNADLWAGGVPQNITGLSIDSATIAGTWVLTAAVID